MSNPTKVVKDLPGKKLTVTRNFSAPKHDVWRAWTEKELLDQWWAPKPWRTETKYLDFKVGGSWLYAMVGPANERHWCRADYTRIDILNSFDITEYFCDENGNKSDEVPTMDWVVNFSVTTTGTQVVVVIAFEKEQDMKTILEMGMEAGFTSALDNLEQFMKERFNLQGQLNTGKARTSTYLNFPGNTEEAFNFYKTVFKSEFSGKGLQRFGQIPPDSGHPPVADSIKNMVLHVELPILGGHVLMATDAPKEMGFTLNRGNNMHICLEPETREEAKRLFDELSAGGNVTMPLMDMFFGAYFGEFSDKFGINWMISCYAPATK